MCKIIRNWFTASLLLALTVSLYAQEGRGNGRLTGSAIDENNNALENVTVTLKYVEYTHSLQTKSNQRGLWGFLGLGRGVAQITGELEGYASYTTQIPISGAGPNPDVRLVLKKGTGATGDESRDVILRANDLFANQKYEEALTLYQEFAQKNPAMYKVGIYIGNCKSELREFEGALAEFKKVLDAVILESPDLKGNIAASQAYAGIGDIYLRQQKFKEAEENFRKSIDIQPSDPALPYNVAEIMFAQNKVDEAETYYRLAIQIKPDWPKPYLKLAYVSLNKGQMDVALEYLKKFREIGKDDPNFAEAQALFELLQKK